MLYVIQLKKVSKAAISIFYSYLKVESSYVPELLEQLHKKITMNQIQNFDILKDQQEYLIKWRDEEFDTLHKLKTAQNDIVKQMDKVQETHLKSSGQVQLISDALVLLKNQTEAVILKYNYMVQYHVDEMHNQLSQLTKRQEAEVSYLVEVVKNGLESINHNIEDMVKMQQDALDSWSHANVGIFNRVTRVYAYLFQLTSRVFKKNI